jgi:Flavin-binding monooxygenase-like
VIHSSAYVNAKPFVGQSVLVIGMGNTGAEIALDLCNGGARTTISLRNGVHVALRDLFGIPIQIVAMFATQILPMKANDALFPLILDMALNHPARYGIKRPKKGILQQIAESGKIPVLDVGTIRKVSEGAIEIMPGTSSAFEDGSYSMMRAEANSKRSSSPLDFAQIIQAFSKAKPSSPPTTAGQTAIGRFRQFILWDSRVPSPDCSGKSQKTRFASDNVVRCHKELVCR